MIGALSIGVGLVVTTLFFLIVPIVAIVHLPLLMMADAWTGIDVAKLSKGAWMQSNQEEDSILASVINERS